MTWIFEYAIGALVWLAVMLSVARLLNSEDARRDFAKTVLLDAVLWPLAALRFARCIVEAVPEALAEHRRENGGR